MLDIELSFYIKKRPNILINYMSRLYKWSGVVVVL